jgi:hypothetical protein
MSKLPLVALISAVALSLASPIIVRAATPEIPKDADQPQMTPSPKKERVQKPVTTPKRDVSTPKGAEAIVGQGEPKAKKERTQKPVTTPKRDVSTPKDADQPQGEPATKPKR